MRARLPLAFLLVMVSILLIAIFSFIYFLLVSRDEGWPVGALAFLAASTVFLLWSVVLWKRPPKTPGPPRAPGETANSGEQRSAEEAGTVRSSETTNRVTTDTNKGNVVQGRDIGRISTAIFNAPVTLVTLFPTMDKHSARRATAVLSVFVFASAVVLVVAPSGRHPAEGEQVAAGKLEQPPPTENVSEEPGEEAEEAEETAGDDDEAEDKRFDCDPSGRHSGAVEAPAPAEVAVWPYTCHQAMYRAPSFVFPADAPPPGVPEIRHFGELDPWAVGQGHSNYPAWAYANGGIDADISAVTFSVGDTGSQSVIILDVKLDIVSVSEPLDGVYLPPPGAGGITYRVLHFDLDDPGARPERYSDSPDEPVDADPWNFPLTAQDADSNLEMFTVSASTEQSLVEWNLVVHLMVDHEPDTIVVDNGGSPFATTSSAAAERVGLIMID